MKNFVPAISLEGFEEANDGRRGGGVYDKVMKAMELLKEHRLPFGISVCYTSKNYKDVSSEEFFDMLIDAGRIICLVLPIICRWETMRRRNFCQRLISVHRCTTEFVSLEIRSRFSLWIFRMMRNTWEDVSQAAEGISILTPGAMWSPVYLFIILM